MAYRPPRCERCKRAAEFVNNEVVHGIPVGKWPYIWRCPSCGDYVGCHEFTQKPKGTLADRKTREARIAAHLAFDPIWQGGALSREDAYAWLASQLGKRPHEVHIGRMGLRLCTLTIRLAEQKRRDLYGTA